MPGTERPSLCPACGQLVCVGVTHCSRCGANLTFSPAAVARSARRFVPSEYPVTAVLLGMNAVIFVITTLLGSLGRQGLVGSFLAGAPFVWTMTGAFAQSVLAGEWWRLVVPMFVHGGLMHVAFNSMALADLGPAVEHNYGSARYLFLYVVTGILGFGASVAWSLITGTPHLSVGGSGAVLGIVGVLLAITVKRGGVFMERVRAQLLRSIGYTFLLGVVINVDNAAHVGGLAAGFVLGMAMKDRPPATPAGRNVAVGLGTGAALAVVAAFVALAVHLIARG
ncbi:MAG: rhomboid family intramembrane serine protease [Deltaproteobacteria bacterium]|nr:rhomboid family intramembrane serine protease [Deltaproteobacteria bacterium]